MEPDQLAERVRAGLSISSRSIFSDPSRALAELVSRLQTMSAALKVLSTETSVGQKTRQRIAREALAASPSSAEERADDGS